MLTYRQLADLAESARDVHVLNVYADLRETNAVARRAWRQRVDDAIQRIRKDLAGAPHAERNEFERCATHLAASITRVVDEGEGRGWVALVAERAVLHLETLPFQALPLVSWRVGIAVAPYLRLIHGERPLLVAMVDTRSAKLYSCNHGRLQHLESLHAHTHTVEGGHMGGAPREHFHTGTRGDTTKDATQRAENAGREHLMRHLTERLDALAGAKGWIVFGGTPMATRAVLRALPAPLAQRALIAPGLAIAATEAEMTRAAADGEKSLREAEESADVGGVLDKASPGGRAVLSLLPTRKALKEGAARTVLLTPRVFETRANEAEELARDVLAHGARLVELSGPAAGRLDAAGEGVGALLRFAPQAAVSAG